MRSAGVETTTHVLHAGDVRRAAAALADEIAAMPDPDETARSVEDLVSP